MLVWKMENLKQNELLNYFFIIHIRAKSTLQNAFVHFVPKKRPLKSLSRPVMNGVVLQAKLLQMF